MGQLFFEAGYRTVFVEANDSLVRLLNAYGRYPLRLLDAASRRELDMTIGGVSALSVRQENEVAEAFAAAAVAGTAVGVANLPEVAPLIARGIRQRRARSGPPIDIYLCENSLDASQVLKDAVQRLLDEPARHWASAHVGFVGTVVARMVPAPGERFRGEDPLFVVADSYHKLPYDARARRAPEPPIEGLNASENFQAEVERKLFSYNLVHAALAYLGYLKGYSYVHEPFEDEEVRSVVYGALEETGRALVRKFPRALDGAGQKEMTGDITLRFSNPMIMDTIPRVARDPIRKLGPNERLIGSARLCLAQDVPPRHVAVAAGAALGYDHPQDPSAVRLQAMIAEKGPEKTLREIAGIDPGGSDATGELGRSIITAYHEHRRGREHQNPHPA
jgi:mannitol-1-phosphate 5-dehydrogenase